MIAIVDYDVGNVGSVVNMFRKLGVPAKLTRAPAELSEASGLLLPGVGAFDQGMRRLHQYGLVSALHDLVVGKRKPILGICLGMQLMAKGSEEGTSPGLGWIDTTVRLFQRDASRPYLRVPHMGWNFVRPRQPVNPLLAALPEPARFYFVHSYHFPADLPCTVATTDYLARFTSVLAQGNIWGCQFHPEKSHRFGLSLLANFGRLAMSPKENT